MDQYLAMQAITRAGAGTVLRAESVRSEQVRAAAAQMCDDEGMRARAKDLSLRFQAFDCHARFQAWLSGLVLVCLLLLPRLTVAEEDAATNVVEFEVQAHNGAGVVRCGLFRQRGWLKDPVRSATVKVASKRAVCVFEGVPSGTYGISAFHDENSDGKLNTNLVGYPTEEYCASNNARNLMSAPSWDDAKFKFRGGRLRLRAVMK